MPQAQPCYRFAASRLTISDGGAIVWARLGGMLNRRTRAIMAFATSALFAVVALQSDAGQIVWWALCVAFALSGALAVAASSTKQD
jgi:hypothetical protein